MIKNLISSIAETCGIAFTGYENVSGGDINEAYCIYANAQPYFLKVNDAQRFPHMFALEEEGLNSLRQHANLQVPSVIGNGINNNYQWLLLEWIEKGKVNINSSKNFGAALANMHLQPQTSFGWHTDNYIGSLVQLNTQYLNWPQFYAECRIMPLVKKLYDSEDFTQNDLLHAKNFCKATESLFPEEPPALLHGDLWSGNYLINKEGNATIFDPAVYCGHREMDIGMTRLFGGFDQSFYNSYNETYPLEKNWQQRLPFTQLYPLLVHAVLFNGHYINQVREIIAAF